MDKDAYRAKLAVRKGLILNTTRLLTIIIPLSLLVGTVPGGDTTSAKSNAPIIIEFGNLKSKKTQLVSAATFVKAHSDYSTSEYARQFVAMTKLLRAVGVQNLTQEETDLILSIPEPTQEAMEILKAEKDLAIQRADERSKAIQDWAESEKQKVIAAEVRAEEIRQADAKAKLEQDKVNAMRHQARATEMMSWQLHAQQQRLNTLINRY